MKRLRRHPTIARLLLALILTCHASCERSSKKKKDDKPIVQARLSLGTCGGGDALFESGPAPAPDASIIAEDTALIRFARSLKASPPATTDAALNAGILGILGETEGGAFASLTGTADFSTSIDDANVMGGLIGNEVGDIPGGWGFGLRDAGPGGGGTGWGTIGTGRYGTIGGSGGAGSGYGSGSRNTPPNVHIGKASATGDLDKNIIRRYIRRKLPKIRHCYERELLVDPDLAGTVKTQFQIGPDGKVAGATARGMGNTKVEDCVSKAIDSILFPKPAGGGIVNVTYPFTFLPATGGSDDSTGDEPKPEPDAPAAAADAPVQADKNTESLLTSSREAIGTCLSPTNGAGYGVMVVELKAGENGTVEVVRVTGDGSESERDCVSKAAASAVIADSPAVERVFRCPLAYGEMDLEESKHIDIREDGVRFMTHEIAKTAALSDSRDGEWRIEELARALEESSAQQRKAVDTNLVAVTGPVVLRPAPQTSAGLLYRVLKTTLAQGARVVLAAEREGAWKPLRDTTLPVAPVPLQSGTTWGGANLASWTAGPRRTQPVISVLIGEKDIWVGNSNAQQMRVEGHDLDAMERALKRATDDASLKSPTVEIAAESPVPYSAVVAVIDRLLAKDDADWLLVDPGSLTVEFDR